jgi:hypothetical protein
MDTQPDCDPERPRFENEPAVVVRFTAAASTSTETKVKSTGDTPPPNSAGETAKTGR